MSVLAVLCSDLHLSERCPPARAEKDSWLDVQAGYLDQIDKLAKEHRCPIVCAGDIFDRHNHPVSFVNWAIRYLPAMFAVPGQHDLPYHGLDRIKDSAYWTLVEAGKISHLTKPTKAGELVMHPFAWNCELTKRTSQLKGTHLAVVHKYVWFGDAKYPGAGDEAHLSRLGLEDYDFAVIGDNHKHFQYKNVFNCGTFMRRKRDEIPYAPRVGLLYADRIEPVELDTNKDNFTNEEAIPAKEDFDVSSIMEELNSAFDSLDFRTILRAEMSLRDKVSDAVREYITEKLDSL